MKPMVEHTKLYKDMILHIMDSFNAILIASNTATANNGLLDPVEYKDTLQSIIKNSTRCLDKVEYKAYPVYYIFKEHIAPLVLTKRSVFDEYDVRFYTDITYFDGRYDRISYGVNILPTEHDYIKTVESYIDLMYMSIRSRIMIDSICICIDSNDITYYSIYDIIYHSIKKTMDECSSIYNNMCYNDASKYDYSIIEEMAILATLIYTKYVVFSDKYTKFMELDKLDNDFLDDDDIYALKSVYEINKSLFDIGTKDPKLLDDTISKIRDIINKVDK